MLSIIIILAPGISRPATWPNRYTTVSDNAVGWFTGNQPSGPIKLFILGDSKSIINPQVGVSNQWPRIFTNMPYWKSNVVFFDNLAASGATIVEVTNQYQTAEALFAPPGSGTNNLIIIRDGANDFPTNSSVSWWINIYSNMLSDIQGRTNCYSCVWDIQPRTDHPDTVVFNRDAMNQALRRLTNYTYIVPSEALVPNAFLTDLFFDGVHANTNGAMAESFICDNAIRLGVQGTFPWPKSYYERASLSGTLINLVSVSAFAFNTTYQNTNGYPMMVRCNYQLVTAAVSGACSFNGYANGIAVATRGENTTASIPADSAIYGDMNFIVPPFGNFAFTNSSTGTGNSVTLFGGQLVIY